MKSLIVLDGNAYYDCPITEQGHFNIPEDYKVVHKRNPARTYLIFTCHACDKEHALVFRETKK